MFRPQIYVNILIFHPFFHKKKQLSLIFSPFLTLYYLPLIIGSSEGVMIILTQRRYTYFTKEVYLTLPMKYIFFEK